MEFAWKKGKLKQKNRRHSNWTARHQIPTQATSLNENSQISYPSYSEKKARGKNKHKKTWPGNYSDTLLYASLLRTTPASCWWNSVSWQKILLSEDPPPVQPPPLSDLVSANFFCPCADWSKASVPPAESGNALNWALHLPRALGPEVNTLRTRRMLWTEPHNKTAGAAAAGAKHCAR